MNMLACIMQQIQKKKKPKTTSQNPSPLGNPKLKRKKHSPKGQGIYLLTPLYP